MVKKRETFEKIGLGGIILSVLFLLTTIYIVFEFISSLSSGNFLAIFISIIFLVLHAISIFGFLQMKNWSLILITIIIVIYLVGSILIWSASASSVLSILFYILMISLAVSLMRKWKTK